MNAMEGRTRKALHQWADGLIVSEHDMDRMEGNLMTLLDSRPTDGQTAPRRRRDWAVAAAAAVALVVGGVALWQVNNDSPPAQPADRLVPLPSQPLVPPGLVGLWQEQPESSWFWEIAADGRILNTDSAAGYLGAAAGAATIIERNGDLYTVVDPGQPDPDACNKLRIQLAEPEVVALRNDCGGDAGTPHRLERVSPRDPAAPPLKPRFATDVSYPVRDQVQLEGSWVHPETNRVLVVVGQPSAGEGLTYLLDDDGDGSVRPDQRGVLTVGADGSVRPQPATGTAGGCAPAFSKVVSTTATLVTTSGENGCFPAGSTQTWLRLT